jgi:hypothetical protein
MNNHENNNIKILQNGESYNSKVNLIDEQSNYKVEVEFIEHFLCSEDESPTGASMQLYPNLAQVCSVSHERKGTCAFK